VVVANHRRHRDFFHFHFHLVWRQETRRTPAGGPLVGTLSFGFATELLAAVFIFESGTQRSVSCGRLFRIPSLSFIGHCVSAQREAPHMAAARPSPEKIESGAAMTIRMSLPLGNRPSIRAPHPLSNNL